MRPKARLAPSRLHAGRSCASASFRSLLATPILCVTLHGCADDDGQTGGPDSVATSQTRDTEELDPSTSGGQTSTPGDATTDDTADAPGTTGTAPEADPLQGRWEPRAPLLGGPRQEVAVVVAAGRMWMLGGLVGAEVLARVEAYDPRDDRWEAQPDLPIAMHHPNAAAVRGRIVVAGFLRGTEFAADGNVFVFDTDAQIWQLGAGMPAGTERGAAATAALDGLVYVIGGRREGVAVADASTYDPEDQTWNPIADLPEPRDHMAIGVIDGRLYVVGGRDGSNIAAHTDRLDVYDPVTDTWDAAAPMPTSRGGMAAGVLGGLLWVAGGEGNQDVPSGVFDELEVYDPAADAWLSLPPMPVPRHGTGGAVIEGVFFVPGGADVEGGGAVDTHEAWTPQR
jgi:N-acetylneuraminic acid mutarotase